MGERYGYEANTDTRNNHTYPFVVLDHGDGEKVPYGRYPVAYTVTMHTAQQYVRQLNENGYIEVV